jgi:hypothetical protein
MGTDDLRPLTLGELLDRAFRLYRRHFQVFVGIMVFPVGIATFTNLLTLAIRNNWLGSGSDTAQSAGFRYWFWGEDAIYWLVYSIALGAGTHAVAEAYLGRNPSVRGAYAAVRAKLWKVVGLVLNVGLRVMVVFSTGPLLLVYASVPVGRAIGAHIPDGRTTTIVINSIVGIVVLGSQALAVFFASRYAVSVPALVFENLGIQAAIRRAVYLTKGRRWQILLATIFALLFANIGVGLFEFPFRVAARVTARSGHWQRLLSFAQVVSGGIGQAMLGSLVIIVLALCYYDARIRKEAFDLQLMLASLEPPSSAAAAPLP